MALFIFCLPILEIYLLIQMSERIGVMHTFLFCLASAAIGALALFNRGRRAMWDIQIALLKEQLPHDALINSVIVFFGGILLIIPGPLTSLIGLTMLFPLTRPLVRRWVKSYFLRKMKSGHIHFYGPKMANYDWVDNSRDVIEIEKKELGPGKDEK